MATLPTPSADTGTWGAELNEFLGVAHDAAGLVKAPLSLTATTVAAPMIASAQTVGNGTGMSSGDVYYPEEIVSLVTATDATATTGLSLGQRSTFHAGSGGAATKGTFHSYTAESIVQGCADTNSEYAAYYAWMSSQIGTGRTQSAGPAGRYWLTDYKLNGPIAVQPGLLNGVTMLINNHYNGSPLTTAAAGQWIVTKAGAGGDSVHNAANTYAVDVGLGIAGIASASAAGFTTGIQLGGAGSGWGVSASRLTTGMSVADYDTHGIKITGKYTGSTPSASLAVADGVGPVVFGGLTTPMATGTLQVLHTAQIDPLVRFGSNAVAGAFSVRFGNSSGVGAIIADTAGTFVTGSAAGDVAIGSLTAGKTLHVIGGSTKVVSVTQDAKLGFFAATPVAKPTVSGAKGSNAALGSLMTALASLGIVTDSTSA